MPQDIIELRLAQDRSGTATFKLLIDRLLASISERPVAGENKRLVLLRSKIEKERLQITDAREWTDIHDAALAAIEVCQDYFVECRTHSSEREEALDEVITVLREAVSKIAKETGDFHAKVLGSSARLTRMTEITDLREIKRQISEEVESLKVMVSERKKEEDATFSRLVRRAETLSIQLAAARDEASRDPLTKLANRGGFDRAIDRWIAQHWKRNGTFSLAMFDVDDFKQINDAHGHPIGDRVLTTIAERLQAAMRETDFAARYGGEEFVVMLEGMKPAQARAKLEDFLAIVARSRFEYEKGGETQQLRFTLSCGVTEYRNEDTREDIVTRADEALYDAKRNGKNRVEVKTASLLSKIFH
jgi:diguanylate cyclase